jgi:hypothetical protein
MRNFWYWYWIVLSFVWCLISLGYIVNGNQQMAILFLILALLGDRKVERYS